MIVLVLYTYEIGKTARQTREMSFLPWIGSQAVVTRMRPCSVKLNAALKQQRKWKRQK